MKSSQQSFTVCSPYENSRAFSFTELLAVIAVITIFGTVGIIAAGMMGRAVQKTKLEQDVQTLNSAIAIYSGNGGDLSGLVNPADILNKLKTTRSAADQKLHAGAPSGRMIDPRIVAKPVESTDWKARAVYSPSKQRFTIADSSTSGVWFDMDEDLNEMSIPVEERSHGVVNYAKNDTWVWDHGVLKNPNGEAGPEHIYTGVAPPNSDPGAGDGGNGSDPDPEPDPEPDPDPDPGSGSDPEPEPDPPVIPRLPYPSYNIAGGAHPDVDFPLNLSLTNVPDPLTANALIKVGASGWQPYTGPVEVPMNTQVSAQYRTLDSTQFKDSWTNSKYFYPIATSLSGTVSGSFGTPQGGENLDTSVTEGGTFFSNGDPTIDLGGEIIDAGAPNTLKFTKSDISDVAPGEQFVIGNLYYHNGTTFNDSHATGVTLQIQIQLQDPSQTLSFDIGMDLVNTDNSSDADASADFVRMTNLTQTVPLSINGVGYQIQLEFGGTDSFGFATSNEFHVYEGATGQGEIRATFVAKP